jgi:hypothetical protein
MAISGNVSGFVEYKGYNRWGIRLEIFIGDERHIARPVAMTIHRILWNQLTHLHTECCERKTALYLNKQLRENLLNVCEKLEEDLRRIKVAEDYIESAIHQAPVQLP